MTYRMYAHYKGNDYFLQASESLARLKLVTRSEVTRWYNELQLSLPLNATKLVIELDGVTKIFQAKANASKFGWQRYRTPEEDAAYEERLRASREKRAANKAAISAYVAGGPIPL